MPYAITEHDGGYQVANTDTGEIHAKHTTRAKAEAQVRLLRGIEHKSVIPHAARDKGHFRSASEAEGQAIRSVKGYGKAAKDIAARAPHTKQARLRKAGAAPAPVDKVGPK